MSVRPLLVSTVLCVLFNMSPLFAADQPPQALLTPPTGKDGAPMVVVPAGSFPMGVPTETGMADAMNIHAMTCLWTPFLSTNSK